MPAPGSYPDIDTNGTNTTPIVSGHATDGFANNEVPTAREFNQILMLIGLWIRWLAAIALGGWVWKAPLTALSNGAVTPPSAGAIAITPYLTMAGSLVSPAVSAIPLEVPVGTTITTVGAYIDSNGSPAPVMSVTLWKMTSAGAVSQLAGGYTGNPSGGWTLYSGALTSPYTVAAGDAVYVEVTCAVASGTTHVGQVGIQRGNT